MAQLIAPFKENQMKKCLVIVFELQENMLEENRYLSNGNNLKEQLNEIIDISQGCNNVAGSTEKGNKYDVDVWNLENASVASLLQEASDKCPNNKII